MAGESISPELKKYRQFLVDCEQKISAGYDKTILTLSGGALAISISFIHDIVGVEKLAVAWLVLVAWGAWALSLVSVLLSYYFGLLAYRRGIRQVDSGLAVREVIGGSYSRIVDWLNAVGGIAFVLGVAFFIAFVFNNLGERT